MITSDAFKRRKKETVSALNRLLVFIQDGEKYGYKNERLIQKINESINDMESKKMKVVLVGGFSEGKTSIAAAWTGTFDENKMKISQAESTDDITVYDFDDYQIVDTPGLFGFKETADKEAYKEITKKYVSEADLVIYVMGASNPIKDSHKETLTWLFKDLGLLDRTIFVLSRFDEEADITDDVEFNETFDEKKKVVKEVLVDFGVIDQSYEPVIVAVAANPYDKGFEYWINFDPDGYKEISHINDLQQATSRVIEGYGGANALVLSKQRTVVRDILNNVVPVINNEISKLQSEISELNKLAIKNNEEIKQLRTKISKARISLRSFFVDYFSDLIVQAEGVGVNTINTFFEKNIGEEGIIIKTKVENEFDKQVSGILDDISSYELYMNTSIGRYNTVMEKIAYEGIKKGGNYLKANKIKIDSDDIIKVRDLFFKNVKFKPWQAVKLAKNIAKGLTYLGSFLNIGVEVWDSFSEQKKKAEVEKAKTEIISNLKAQQAEFISLVDNDDIFVERFFPNYIVLKNEAENMQSEVSNKQQFIFDFNNWKKEGDAIDASFTIISAD